MTSAARKLYEEALTLTDDDRADLAALLLGSLDGKPEAQVESTRLDEVAKRRDLARRRRILSELTAEAQEMGLYD